MAVAPHQQDARLGVGHHRGGDGPGHADHVLLVPLPVRLLDVDQVQADPRAVVDGAPSVDGPGHAGLLYRGIRVRTVGEVRHGPGLRVQLDRAARAGLLTRGEHQPRRQLERRGELPGDRGAQEVPRPDQARRQAADGVGSRPGRGSRRDGRLMPGPSRAELAGATGRNVLTCRAPTGNAEKVRPAPAGRLASLRRPLVASGFACAPARH